MKQKFEILMVACLFAGSFFLARFAAQAAAQTEPAQPCIVLDAGHGADDPGKIGCGNVLEKDINLAIVLKLQKLFENKGFRVVLTRSDDTVLADENSRNVKVEDMRNRVKLITEADPVMTISIHQNSYTDSSVSGPQVFYYEQSAEGAKIAAILQEQLNASLEPEKPRACKSNGSYYILKKTPTPTVIVECGFLSNEAETALLVTDEYQQKLARAVYLGACAYLNRTGEETAETESSESLFSTQ